MKQQQNIEDTLTADDYYRIPAWTWGVGRKEDIFTTLGIELAGRGTPFITREQALGVVNKARKAGVVNGCRFQERADFVPAVIVAFPYQLGWDQGTYIFASIDRECRTAKSFHPFEITAKGYPRRKVWYPKPSEFPSFKTGETTW